MALWQGEFYRPGQSSCPKFIDRAVQVLVGKRDVFEAAAERVVIADAGPVDSHRGVDRRFDVLRLYVALAGPAEIYGVRASGVCRADGAAALDSRAGEDCRHLQPVVAAARWCDRSDRASKFPHH